MTMTPADLDGVSEPGQEPDPGEKAKRRSFTTEYKLAIVAEYDAGDAQSRGALLRRERLQTSHLSEWRRARDAGTLAGPNRGSRKAGAGQAELDRLRRKNERLQQELDKASWRWRSWEKHTRSWRRSPRARTPGAGAAGNR